MTFMASSSPPFGGAAAIKTLSCVLPRLRGSTLGGAFSSRVKLAFGFAIPMRHHLSSRKTPLLFSCLGVTPVHSKLASQADRSSAAHFRLPHGAVRGLRPPRYGDKGRPGGPPDSGEIR